MGLLIHLAFLILILCSVEGKSNKRVTLPSNLYCGDKMEIDGATVQSLRFPSTLYKNSACIVKFKADDSKLLVNLTDVHIGNCGPKLSVYFDDDTYGSPAHVIDCRTLPPGVVNSRDKYVTLRFDGTFETPDRYNIILTSYHTKTWDCEFKCNNGYCIDKDLKCDRIDHCSDNSDEQHCGFGDGFSQIDGETAAKTGLGVTVGVVLVVVVLCVGCCVGIICCCRRRQGFKGRVLRGPASQATTTTTNIPPPPQPAAQPLMPMQAPYQPAQPGAYPPPQASGYPPQPAGMPQPAPYPQQPAPYPQQPAPYPQQPAPYPQQPYYESTAPPAYQEKGGAYPAPPPINQQLEKSSDPGGLMPSAPPR